MDDPADKPDSAKIDRDAVARRAGVSSATVSRVYNRPQSVSATRRAAVMQAADELGYRPNKAASALGRKNGNLILFVDLDHSPNYFWGSPMFYSWYFAEALQGALEVVEDSLFSLAPVRIHDQADLPRIIKERQPAGLIFFDAVQRPLLEKLQDLGLPVVAGHHLKPFSDLRLHRCITDNHFGGTLAGQCLRDSGHKSPAYIVSALDSSFVHQARWQGFCEGFGDAGAIRLVESQAGKEGGLTATRSLIADIRTGAIDSIGVVNDYTAMGVILALYRQGILIPRDVSIVSYDNLPFSEALPFPITTVDLHMRDIYRQAVSLLIDIMQGRAGKGIFETRNIRPQLVAGGSVQRRN